MIYFLQLVRRSFGIVFATKKTFLQSVFIPFVPFVLLVGVGFLLSTFIGWSGVDVLSLGWTPKIIGIIGIVIGFIIFVGLSIVCSYLSARVLYNLTQGKIEPLRDLISHYQKSGKYFTTSLAMGVYILGWMMLSLVLLLTGFIHSSLFIVSAVIIFLAYILVIFSQTFTYSYFFFENKTGFDAVFSSYRFVKGHFWKMLGIYFLAIMSIILFIVLLIVIAYGVDYVLGLFHIVISPNSPAVSFLLQAIQIIIQAVLGVVGTAFTFSIFMDHNVVSTSIFGEKNVPTIKTKAIRARSTVSSRKISKK